MIRCKIREMGFKNERVNKSLPKDIFNSPRGISGQKREPQEKWNHAQYVLMPVEEINQELINGVSVRKVAESLSETSLHRHQGHILDNVFCFYG